MPARCMPVCTPNQMGMTATMWAASAGHAECVELLIAAGANLKKTDKVSERVRERGGCMWQKLERCLCE